MSAAWLRYIGCYIVVRECLKTLAHAYSFNLHNSPLRLLPHWPHFTDQSTELQRGFVNCPRSLCWLHCRGQRRWFILRSLNSWIHESEQTRGSSPWILHCVGSAKNFTRRWERVLWGGRRSVPCPDLLCSQRNTRNKKNQEYAPDHALLAQSEFNKRSGGPFSDSQWASLYKRANHGGIC